MSSFYSKLRSNYMALSAVDFENLQPPAMEGLDALLHVSCSSLYFYSCIKVQVGLYSCFFFLSSFLLYMQKKKRSSQSEQNGKIDDVVCSSSWYLVS